MTNSKQNLRSKSGERHQTEVGGSSNPQQTQRPRYISDTNPHTNHEWNPVSIHNPLAVMGERESEDDEATPSVVRALSQERSLTLRPVRY